MEIVKGIVASKSRKGNSIKVGDDWFSTFKSEDLDHVNWKDEVEFMYETKGKYKNIKGRVEVKSGGSAPVESKGGGYSNLGVEIGHASNLAMRMMEQGDFKDEVGSAWYFKRFAEYTKDMYKVMQVIRKNIERGDNEDKEPVKTKPKVEADVDMDDIF